MTEEPNDISSDLEWILESGQADQEMLIDALVQKHYVSIYRLAFAMLANTRSAHQASMQAIAAAALDFPQRRGITQVNTWLYGHAAKTITHLDTANKDKDSIEHTLEDDEHTTEELVQSAVVTYMNSQGRRERFALAYYYLLEFNLAEIATLLQVNHAAISAQLEIARADLREIPIPGLDEDAPLQLGYSKVQFQAEQQARLDAAIKELFQTSYPAPQLESNDWDRILEQIQRYQASQPIGLRRYVGWKQLTIALVTVTALIAVFWGVNMLLGLSSLPAGNLLSPQETSDDSTIFTQPTAGVEPVFPPAGEEQVYIYIVQPGDSMESIALKLTIPLERLSEWNQVSINAILNPGDQLFVIPLAYETNIAPTEPSPESIPKKTRLKESDNSIEVTQMLRSSADRWDTMWVDAILIDYGPVGYIGMPRIYHSQAWVDQPDQSLELLSLLNEDPSSARLISNNNQFALTPGNQLPMLSTWDADRASLVYNQQLRQMIFPSSAPWTSPEGRFQMIDKAEIAGRETVVTDWYNPLEQRQARLWLDVENGTALRMQEYGGPDYQTLISDTLVVSIVYDLEIPSEAVFDPHSLVNQGFASLAEEDNLTEDPYGDLLELPLVSRPDLPIDTAPVGFNPAISWLHFQYQDTEHHNPAIGSTPTDPSTLFADGYYLGQAVILPPWGLQCTRSPDGQRLAFNRSGDGIEPPDMTLRWLNVREPDVFYEPLPGFEAEYFTFSPDSRRLAVFGRNPQNIFSGVQIVDLGTGESQTLIELAHADSIVWSPDGSYIALVGQRPDSPNHMIMIVQVRLGDVIFERPVEMSGGTQQFSWSSMAWGLEFPLPMGDLGDCAEPP